MYCFSSSIGAILAGRQRIERARHERVRLERHYIQVFCEKVILASMQRLAAEFARHGRSVEIDRVGKILSMTVSHGGKVEFRYTAAASRHHRSRTRPGRHRDRYGYAHSVDRVYSLRDARTLGPEQVYREIVLRYRRQTPA